ncbi:MAG: hypothetical protein K1X67_00320 [Fimbriimonadaceae bacterium]|nr:hypothetical protein [Fimbriimonadaceae bacterium]
MIQNKNLAIAVCALAFVGGAASQAIAQSVQVTFLPYKPRYGPGERVTVVVTVRDGRGYRFPGAPVCLNEYISSRGISNWSDLKFTNYAGEARYAYNVPTNTSYDNIYLTGWANVNGRWYSSPSVRFPIGR